MFQFEISLNLNFYLGAQNVDRILNSLLYTRYRYLHGLGEGHELTEKIPLEMNLDLLNYISFTKGCYVGQELIARTKHKV